MNKQILPIITSVFLVLSFVNQVFSQRTEKPKIVMELTAVEGYLIIPGKTKELIYSVELIDENTPINKMIVIDNGRSISYSVGNGTDHFTIALAKGLISCDSILTLEETDFKVLKTESFKCKTISSFFFK